ncbi:MAG TPA: WD40 repeat domain-containing protein, partial [Vicinamibacteria bacterium]
GYLAATASRPVSSPTFRPLTFRRGYVGSARFMPDGETVVYGARWDGAPVQAFSTRLGSPESTALSLPSADVLSVSRSGELLVSLGRHFIEWFITSGRLARAPLSGGAPRELMEDVEEASWTPDGQRLLVVRYVGGKSRIELGSGNVLYETAGWVSHARLSPRGDLVAFLEHPLRGGDNGSLAVIAASGKGAKRALTGLWTSVQGLAWSHDGSEIWFTGAETGWHSALYGVTPAGRSRLVLRIPGRLNLQDIDARGRVLLTNEHVRVGAVYGSVETGEERDVSWLESSFAVSLTPDGRKILINEQGEGAGQRYGVYIRDADGSPAVRLGDGLVGAFSPDGRFVATITMDEPPRLAVLPTGAGEARTLPAIGVNYWSIGWFPDGRRLVSAGPEPDHGSRLYVQDLTAGPPRSFTGEGFGSIVYVAVSPDGKWAAAAGPGRMPFLCPIEGGRPVPLSGLQPGDGPLRFSPDGRWLYLARAGETSSQIVRFDVEAQVAEVRRELRPRDPYGVLVTAPTDITPDGRHYVYTYLRELSDLFLVEGLR